MTKLSGLPAAGAFATSLEFYLNDSGTSRKLTGTLLKAAFPWGTLAYAQVTANQGTYTAATDLTSLTVTLTPGAGRRIKITGWAPQVSSVATDAIQLQILDGATVIMANEYTNQYSGGTSGGSPIIVVLTPTNVSHTYKLQGLRAAGTGNITMSASTTTPAFILVEDVGV